MYKKIVFISLFSFLISCQKDAKDLDQKEETKSVENSVAKDTHSSKNSLDYTGVYEGEFPCEDCDYIAYKVLLREDKTFYTKYVYVGKDDNIISEEGSYYWSDDGKVIILKSKKQATKFKVGEKILEMLSQGDMKIKPALREKYFLYKTQ
jgi:uncharacterized lipoprotein NlpE involved in copper resistance